MKSHLVHLIISLAITAILFVCYGFLYLAISKKSAEVAGIQGQIVAKKETLGRINSAREALVEIAGDESLVQNYFVPEDGIVGFIDKLEQKGIKQGSEVNILSVSKGKDEKDPTLVISLSIAGTFNTIVRTVGSIEYAPYVLKVSELSVTKEEKGVWNANMKIIVGSLNKIKTTP